MLSILHSFLDRLDLTTLNTSASLWFGRRLSTQRRPLLYPLHARALNPSISQTCASIEAAMSPWSPIRRGWCQ